MDLRDGQEHRNGRGGGQHHGHCYGRSQADQARRSQQTHMLGFSDWIRRCEEPQREHAIDQQESPELDRQGPFADEENEHQA